MGTIIKGILGGFSGKVGTVIGASWRGIDYMRSLPKKSGRPATQLQLDQRYRFGLVTAFLGGLDAVIKVGYQKVKAKETPMNVAVTYNLDNAITGASPNYLIDFAEVRFSEGKLAIPSAGSVVPEAAAVLNFEWGLTGNAAGTDQATLVAYNPGKKQFVYLQNAAMRSELEFGLQMPLDYSGDEVECYMSFVSADGKAVSNSVYLGQVTVL